MGDRRPKKTRKQHSNKVRVRLPGIESYEKELEFTAEGPGRVVVRLERLMGSDRIRITDPKYLATLVERLESEETRAWVSRSRLRKKAEKNRSRQLAIDGLMEPTEDMQDLYNHPVFRVNRVLNRLNLFDMNMSHPGASGKLPAIEPVEPFCDDDTGAVFKKYNGHTVVMVEDLPDYESHHTLSNTDMLLGRTKTDIIMEAKGQGAGAKSRSLIGEENEEGDEEAEEGEQSEGGEEEEGEEQEVTKLEDLPNQLADLQKFYGVPSDENLVRNWQPFRSNLVDMVFDDQGDQKELYGLGEDVTGVYARQHETVREYVGPLEQQAQELIIASGLKSQNPPPPLDDMSKGKGSVSSNVKKDGEGVAGEDKSSTGGGRKSDVNEGEDEGEEGDQEELEALSEKPAESENPPESEEAAPENGEE